MQDNIFPEKKREEEANFKKESEFIGSKEREGRIERREELIKRERLQEQEERLVPTIEKLKSSVSAPPSFQQRDLTQEEKNIIDDLVRVTIKNPDIENGLEEANKILNKEIKKLKNEGRDYAYLIDEFHDRLVQKIQEIEVKLNK